MNKHIPVDYALFRLNEIFQVKEIANELVTAKDIQEAMTIRSHMDFDRIPIKVNGKVSTYYDFDSNSEKKIELQEIISESTGVLETIIYLSKRDFYFVLSGNDITHIVHYSDLSNPLVLTPLYTQISYCEIEIRKYARSNNTNNSESGIEQFLNNLNQKIPKDKKQIKVNVAVKHFKDKLANETQTDIFNELYFDDELILIRELFKLKLNASEFKKFSDYIDLSDKTITLHNKLRNEIMHSKPQIIKKKSDISGWLKFLDFCQKLINVINDRVSFN